jgi:hypothetical protein
MPGKVTPKGSVTPSSAGAVHRAENPKSLASDLKASDFKRQSRVPFSPTQPVGQMPKVGMHTVRQRAAPIAAPPTTRQTAWIHAARIKDARSLVVLPHAVRPGDAAAICNEIRKDSKNRPVVYLASPQSLFHNKRHIEHALKNGGTLVLNLHAFKEAQHLVTTNSLLDLMPSWLGTQAEKELRVIGLISQADLETDKISGDYASRFLSTQKCSEEHLALLPTLPKISYEKHRELTQDEVALNLFGSRNWRDVLSTRWADAKKKGKTVLIRNLPDPPAKDDCYVELQWLQARDPQVKIIIQTAVEKTEPAAEKTAPDTKTPIVVVNQGNFDRLFCYGFGKVGQKVTQEPILATMAKRPLLRLSDDLLPAQRIAIGDLGYKIVSSKQDSKPSAPVEILSYDDTALAWQNLQKSYGKLRLVDVSSPVVALGDLVERIHTDDKDQIHITEGMLFSSLAKGETVVLQGLHQRPDLQALLSGLFCERPYLIFNNRVVLLDDTKEFPGKILILEDAKAETPNLLKSFQTRYNISEEVAATDLQRLDDLFTALAIQGVPEAALRKSARHLQMLFDCVYDNKDAKAESLTRWQIALQQKSSPLLQALLGSIEDPQLRLKSIEEIEKLYQVKLADVMVGDIQGCVDILKRQRALFLIGTPGAGKSYTAQEIVKTLHGKTFFARNIGSRHSDEFLKTIEAWAKDDKKTPAVLIVDEANLAEPHFWELLSSTFKKPPSVTIMGQTYPLDEHHKIIFTGNSYHVAGRYRQEIIDDCFITVPFAPMTREHLEQRIVKPFLEDLKLDSQLAEQLLRFHDFFETHFPSEPCTVRCLKNVMIRTQALKPASKDLVATMLQQALEIYAGALPLAEQHALGFWVKKTFRIDIVEVDAKDAKKSSQDIVWVPSALRLKKQIDRELYFRQARIDAKNPNSKLGHRALILEGPPARGKDQVVQAALKAKNVPFIAITAGMGLSALKEAIQRAQREGLVVIISELNLLPANILEGEFNDLLTDDKAKDGFMVIGTINPPEFSGRERLSPAFRNRVRYLTIEDYTQEEQQQILLDKKIPQDAAKKIIDYHQAITAKQKARGYLARPPTTRQLLAVAQRFQSETLQSILEDVYGFYSLTAKQAGDAERSIDPHRAAGLAWVRLLWPEAPFTKIDILSADSFSLPQILPGTLLLKEPFSLDQIIGAVAVARFAQDAKGATTPRDKAKACLKTLEAATGIRGDKEAFRCAIQLLTVKRSKVDQLSTAKKIGLVLLSPLLLAGGAVALPFIGAGLVLQSRAKKKRKDAVRKSFSMATTAGPLNMQAQQRSAIYSVDATGDYGTWTAAPHHESLYLASSYFSPKTEALISGEREAVIQAAARAFQKPKGRPAATVVVQRSQLQYNRLPEMPVLTGHAPWVKARTNQRYIEQWGVFQLNPDEKLLCLEYSLYPVDYKVRVPAKKEVRKENLTLDLESDFKEWPDLKVLIQKAQAGLKAHKEKIPVDAKAQETHDQWLKDILEQMVEVIQKNTKYCATPAERQAAAKIYQYNNPTPRQFLQYRLGVCAEGNQLLAIIADQFLQLPTRCVVGWRGNADNKISATGHAWVEVFISERWRTYDATPDILVPLSPKTFDDYQPPPVPESIKKHLQKQLKDDKWRRAVLQHASIAGDKASRQTTDIKFSASGDITFTSLELDVDRQKIPIVLSWQQSSSAFAQFMRNRGAQVLSVLLSEGFQIFVRGPHGDLQAMTSVRDIMGWGSALPRRSAPLLVQKDPNMFSIDLHDLVETLMVDPQIYLWLPTIDREVFQKIFGNQALPPGYPNGFTWTTIATIVERSDLVEDLEQHGFSSLSVDYYGYTSKDYQNWRDGKEELDLNSPIDGDPYCLGIALLRGGSSYVDKLVETWKPSPEFLANPKILVEILNQGSPETVYLLLKRWTIEGYLTKGIFDQKLFSQSMAVFVTKKLAPKLPRETIELLKLWTNKGCIDLRNDAILPLKCFLGLDLNTDAVEILEFWLDKGLLTSKHLDIPFNDQFTFRQFLQKHGGKSYEKLLEKLNAL